MTNSDAYQLFVSMYYWDAEYNDTISESASFSTRCDKDNWIWLMDQWKAAVGDNWLEVLREERIKRKNKPVMNFFQSKRLVELLGETIKSL